MNENLDYDTANDFEQIDEEMSEEHNEGFVMKFNELSEKTQPFKKRFSDKVQKGTSILRTLRD